MRLGEALQRGQAGDLLFGADRVEEWIGLAESFSLVTMENGDVIRSCAGIKTKHQEKPPNPPSLSKERMAAV